MSYAMRTELRTSALTTAAMLASFAAAVAIQRFAHQGPAIAVLAVVLVLTLRRTVHRHRLGPLQLLAVPVVGICAAGVGRLMLVHPDLGDALFVVAISATIWVRRFGSRATRIGTLIALPFVAMLITPVPPTSGPGHLLWSAVVALVAVGAVLLTQLAEPPPEHHASTRPAGTDTPQPATTSPATTSAAGTGATATSATATGAAGTGATRARRRFPASTRMALQMAVALTVAFGLGRLMFAGHWPWLVLSAYLVNAGSRGRGDVVYKGVQRVVGAAAGTVVATLAAGAFRTHSPASIALIFVVLAVAGWLRRYSYAYWAAGVTGALSLLYGYFGTSDAGVLGYRLVGIVVGALIGVAAAWLVLPVPTHHVLRRRLADVLAALTDYLITARRDPSSLPGRQRHFEHSLDELDTLTPTLRAHRRLLRTWRPGPYHADAVSALLDCRAATGTLTRYLTDAERVPDPLVNAGLDGLRDDVVALRRAMAGRGPLPEPRTGDEHPHPALGPLHHAVTQTGAILGRQPG